MSPDNKIIPRRSTAALMGLFSLTLLLDRCIPDGVNGPLLNPTPTPTPEFTPSPTMEAEKLEAYGRYLIGESGVGSISELKLQTNPDQAIVDEVKTRALEAIPETNIENLGVYVYDMVGEKGKTPFILLSVNNDQGEPENAFVGFWVDEQGIQRPPKDGKIYAFYPLRIINQEDGSVSIGIPDALNTGMQLPELFFIDKDKNTFFLPPFTDHINPPTMPNGIKIAALDSFIPNLSPEAPSLPAKLGPEYIQIIEDEEYLNSIDPKTGDVIINFGYGDELAFKKLSDGSYEMQKFYWPNTDVSTEVENLNCKLIRDKTKEGNCIQEARPDTTRFFLKFVIGRIGYTVTEEGWKVYFTEAHFREEKGDHEKIQKIALWINTGNEKNSLTAETAKSEKEILDRYKPGTIKIFSFKKSGSMKDPVKYFEDINKYVPTNMEFYNGTTFPSVILFPSGLHWNGTLY